MSDHEGLLRASVGGRRGDRVTLLIGGLVAALLLVGAAILAAGAPASRAPMLATTPTATAPSMMSLAASRGVGSDQRRFWIARARNELRATDSAQQMRATFSSGGVLVAVPGGAVSLSLRAVSRGARQTRISPVTPAASFNRVSYARGGLTEWYANGPLGLEQGLTLRAPPATASGATGELGLSYALSGAAARLADGQLVFSGARGEPILRYAGLSATDATGRRLPSQLKLDGDRLTIAVNDRGARYPITVDPLMQVATISATEAGMSAFGFRVAVSGSTMAVADGDILGTPANTLAGAAFVFIEPGNGWATTTTPAAELTAANVDYLGESVAVSGNTVFVVGDNSSTGNSDVYVYTKPSAGWSDMTAPTALLSPPSSSDNFGSVEVAPSASGDTLFALDQNVGVFIYKEPAGGWTSSASGEADAGELTVPGTSGIGAFLDGSMGVSGQYFVVGAPAVASGSSIQQGAVYVFKEPGTGWTSSSQPTATLTAPDGMDGDLGYRVAIDSTTIVASAVFATVNSVQGAGEVFVYSEPSTGWAGSLTPTAQLSPSGEPADATGRHLFGLHIAVGQVPTGSGTQTNEAVFVGTGDGTGIYEFSQPSTGWASVSSPAMLGYSNASAYSLALAGSYLYEGDDTTNYSSAPPTGPDDGQVNVIFAPAGSGGGGGGGGGGGAPVLKAPPTITGTAQPGDTLTAHPGTWTNSPKSFHYQWLRNGVPIPGAASRTYVVQIADEAHTLSCRVSATGAGGATSASPVASVGAFVGNKQELKCVKPSGQLGGTKVGPLAIGMPLAQAKHKLTRFRKLAHDFTDFCLYAGFGIRAAVPSTKFLRSLKSGLRSQVEGKLVIALTANPFYRLDGVRPGERIAAVARHLHAEKPFKIGLNDWYFAPTRSAEGVLKVRNGLIYEIGLANKKLTTGSRTSQRKFMSTFSS